MDRMWANGEGGGKHGAGTGSGSRKGVVAITALVFAVAGGVPFAGAVAGASVAFEPMDLSRYASAIRDAGDGAGGASCAAIGSVEAWDDRFLATATMTPNEVYAPPADFFAGKVLLVVARIVPGAADTRYDISSVTRTGRAITVTYRSSGQEGATGYSVSSTMALAVEKGDWTTVSFAENGRTVCTATAER